MASKGLKKGRKVDRIAEQFAPRKVDQAKFGGIVNQLFKPCARFVFPFLVKGETIGVDVAPRVRGTTTVNGEENTSVFVSSSTDLVESTRSRPHSTPLRLTGGCASLA